MGGLTDIKQLLPKNVYDAAVGANSPSASNVFATISDLSGGGGIYGGSGSTQIGTTVVTMAATDVVRFDSLNGPQAGLFTIDAVNNRIGVNIAAPGYAFHLGSGDAYFQNGNVAIGTTPTLGYKLYLATDNTDGNNHRGQRIVLGGDSVTAAAQISGLEIRTLNTKTAAGTNNYRFIDINATGGATQGTYNLYGMRVKLDAFSNLGTATINKYIGEFVDGTEGLGKVLSDVTGGGLARWVDPNTLVSTPALSTVLATGNTTGANNLVISTGQRIVYNNSTFNSEITTATLTSDRLITLQDADGTVALLSDITGTNSGTNTGDQNSGTTFIISNDNTLRTINANSINGASLRDLVCTLIRDLNTAGVLTV